MPLASQLDARQRGATLIEVMVALFLMAVGLLGMLSLQNSSQRSNQTAMFSSVAVVLARDMANRIMFNDDKFSDADNDRYSAIDTLNAGDNECTSDCDGEQLRDADVSAWAKALGTQLPAGRGKVEISAAGIHQVTVMWDDQLTGADGDGCSGNPEVDLRCVKLEFRL